MCALTQGESAHRAARAKIENVFINMLLQQSRLEKGEMPCKAKRSNKYHSLEIEEGIKRKIQCSSRTRPNTFVVCTSNLGILRGTLNICVLCIGSTTVSSPSQIIPEALYRPLFLYCVPVETLFYHNYYIY